MPLKPVVESLEGISEDLHEDYEQTEDGKYQLKVLSGFVPKDKVEDVSGLKSALQKERENARAAAARAKKLEEQVGEIDPEDYRRLKELEAKAEEEKAKKAGEWDKLRSQMLEKHQEELAKRDKERDRLMAALEAKLIDAEIASAINAEKGKAKPLIPIVKNRVRMREDDKGGFTTVVVDDAGDTAIDPATGEPLTVRGLLAKMAEDSDYAMLFEPRGQSGGGTPPNGAGNSGGTGKKGGIPSDLKRSQMSTKDKVAFVKEHGEDAFLKLPA